MKRKAEAQNGSKTTYGANKKPATDSNSVVHGNFGENVFDTKTLKAYTTEYADSKPYKHAVVRDLINDKLLRNVRSEILENIHFTPKETDIYKIHQSGDLANLSGLPASALQKLPSLLTLRDTLYSQQFRAWISQVSGAGPLSGSKTDMAVNVYAPGCHLLCHDDVIGSRRVSYILYLTDPDKPWKADWGGALRLYPTDEMKDDVANGGKVFKVPRPEWSKVIPPAWNQLSFFAVQPGESFHDVEEVYKRPEGVEEDDGGRVRMAISGWFHIPQEGEEGFEPGLEEKLAEKSSLQQLQGKADQFDLPQPQWTDPEEAQSGHQPSGTNQGDDDEDIELSEQDLQFLLQFMTPNYLTPDTVEELNDLFTEESTVQLTNFLSKKLAPRLREQLETTTPSTGEWRTSRPPHKHRYQYLQPSSTATTSVDENPFQAILNLLLPSLAFRKWLSLVTGLTLKHSAIMARKFRQGLDYQLATGYEGKEAQVEYTLCVTPSKGWGAGDDEDANADAAEAGEQPNNDDANGESGTASKPKPDADADAEAAVAAAEEEEEDEEDNVGGYELYMAGDDPDSDSDSDADTSSQTSHDLEIPAAAKPASSSATGAGNRAPAHHQPKNKTKSKKAKADPAVYQAAKEGEEAEDDGVLFSNPANWNSLSVVLRDRGTLKFVKYVSAAARGERWDFVGGVEVVDDGEGEDDSDEGENEGPDSVGVDGEEEEEFVGFGD
ncbi:hypothetical protein MBLNU230_g3190t1 [Neophaeotheca triangularis]